MAIIEGQIESLKKIKEILKQNGIERFHSIAEINNFIKNYNPERNEIPKIIQNALDVEISALQSDYVERQKIYDDLKDHVSNEIIRNIKSLKENLDHLRDKSNRGLISKIFLFPKVKVLANKISKLEKNFEKLIRAKTSAAEHKVIKSKNTLDKYIENKDVYFSERCMEMYQVIDHTKEVVDGLYTLIAGAIGESEVVKELQNLSDGHILFNDFSVEFNPPIFNRKENDRIYSIQIDHLLVCNAGIFILETKNWSKQSIENLDLRSPVKQIMRTSYALFVLLNSESQNNNIKLDRHHWGTKQVPVRNIIVMIHEKPKEKFKYVKVVTLNELIGYITYYDSIFSDAEVKSISEYLRIGQTGGYGIDL